jgi:hypothetical protein
VGVVEASKPRFTGNRGWKVGCSSLTVATISPFFPLVSITAASITGFRLAYYCLDEHLGWLTE